MKKLILLSYALLISTISFAQQGNNFKSRTKTQMNNSPGGFTFKTISNNRSLKSGVLNSNYNFPVSTTLQVPKISNHDSVQNLISDNGSPIFFERASSKLKSTKAETTAEHFYSFFESTKATTQLFQPKDELVITRTLTDNLGITHVKAQQYYKGVKVYGAELYLHMGADRDLFTGRIESLDPAIESSPGIDKLTAINIVSDDLKERTILKNLSAKEKELLKYDRPESELVIYDGKLAYEISYRPNMIEEWKYFVDANSKEIIQFYNNTNSDGPTIANAYDLNGILRSINTYLEAGTYYLYNISEAMFNSTKSEGIIMTLDANNTSTTNLNYSFITSTNNTWTNRASVSAHYNAKQAYTYFKNTFNRNSINDQGGDILSLVNVAEEDGASMENAYWNGRAVFYGNGGTYFKPLAGALDVTAHELGHGIVSNTANLEYYEQPGAINETYADIFGSMVDRDDWLIGEDIVKTAYYPSGALRNMSDPHNGGNSSNHYWQPKHLTEMYIGEEDNAGVHTNSGIGNYAYYLFATAVGKAKAEQVFYKALNNYLISQSKFIDFRLAVVQSAKDLYGNNSTEATEAGKAFDAIGVYEDSQIDYAQEYEVNPGQEYLLSYDTDTLNANTLYRSSTTGTNFMAYTTTIMKGKVCVSDNGGTILFVSNDHKIRAMSSDPNTPNEYIISNEAFWDNVTLSKDRNRLAAISTQIDTAIYVYDFITQQWAKFMLYNPTTSNSGDKAGGVLYADAIEFDHTGEYIIYDAYNSIHSTLSSDINYWDIGIIKVWDNQTDDFGNGIVTKLYGSLPDDVSIGNPTFSKNSPYIIAFDYLNGFSNEYAILGANLLNGNVETITTNATVGFPSYSKNDDKIAFAALNTSNREVVASINLASDKISGSGSASIIVSDAKWPVFYATGVRDLKLEPVANFTADVKTGSAPLTVKFYDLSINGPIGWSWIFTGGSPATSSLQNPTVIYNSPGTYQVKLTSSNDAGNNSITKTAYVIVSATTAIDEPSSKLFTLYPNPTSDRVYVYAEKYFRLRIFSSIGTLVKDVYNEKEVDLSSLPDGLYILKLETEGKIITSKIIKQ